MPRVPTGETSLVRQHQNGRHLWAIPDYYVFFLLLCFFFRGDRAIRSEIESGYGQSEFQRVQKEGEVFSSDR